MTVDSPNIFDDVHIFDLDVHEDKRGMLFESYRADKKLSQIQFCQENIVFSKYGVLRGLHFQKEPYTQSKLITVIKGEIQDVVVDIRKSSKTFGRSCSFILSDIKGKQLFIPKGFAHGFLTLSKNSIVQYKVDNYYNPVNQSAIAYNDRTLNINWILDLKDIILSDKDIKNKTFEDTTYFK